MEMLSSLRGDKHEFCHVVIKFKHVRSCPSFNIIIIIIMVISKCHLSREHIALS